MADRRSINGCVTLPTSVTRSGFPFLPCSSSMSGKYPAPSKSRVPWLSRFKKRVSASFAPASSDPSRLPSVADVPSHYVDVDIPPSSVAHHPSGSISTTSVPSTANTARASSALGPTYSTRHAEDSSYSSTHLAPPASPSRPQGQALIYQGTSVSVLLNV